MESALIGCFFAALPCGTSYGFSLYSEAMQHQMKLSSGELLNITTIPQVFGILSPLWGFFVVRFGVRAGLIIGGLLGGVTLVLQYLVCMKTVSFGPPAVSLLILAILQFQGQAAVTAVAFPVPVQHYQQRRGKATALVKCFVGLSGAMVAQVFWLFVGNRPHFEKTDKDSLLGLLLWALMSVGGAFVALLFIPTRAEPDPAKESDFRLNILFWFLLAWGAFSIIVGVEHSHLIHFILAIGLLVMMFALPGFLLFWRRRGPLFNAATGGEQFEAPTQKSFAQMLTTTECWCLFVCATGLISGGIVISNSISDILTAAGNDSAEVNVLAETLYSSGNMLGRLTCMLPSDALVRRGYPRPLILIFMMMLMCVSHTLFLMLPASGGSEGLVAPAAFLGGYSFGSIWPHLVVIASELFGTASLSANYMFYDGTVSCVASLLIGRVLVGAVLDAHTEPHALRCHGAGCFRLTHFVIIATNVVGILAALVMMRKSMPTYRLIFQALHGD